MVGDDLINGKKIGIKINLAIKIRSLHLMVS